MRLGFLLALVVFCIALAGKSFAQDADLSAEEIIQILQQNPDVLAEAGFAEQSGAAETAA